MKTGIGEGHTLSKLFEDILSGEFIGYLTAPAGTVAEYLAQLREDVDRIAERLGIAL